MKDSPQKSASAPSRAVRIAAAVDFLGELSKAIRILRQARLDSTTPTAAELLFGSLIYRFADGAHSTGVSPRAWAWQRAQHTRLAVAARLPKRMREGAELLWVPRHGNHLRDMLQVALRRRERGQSPGVFVVLAGAMLLPIRAAGLPWIDCAPYLYDDWRIEHERESLKEACRYPLGSVRRPEPPLWTEFRLHTMKHVEDTLEQAVVFRDAFNGLVEQVRPRCIVVGNPTLAEGRAATWSARRVGASTVTIQHGDLVRDEPAWADVRVDHYCSWGQHGADMLPLLSAGTTNVHVTGAPWLDAERRARKEKKSSSLVLVALSGAGHSVSMSEHLACLDRLAETVRAMPELDWRIRLHPKDDPNLYATRFDKKVTVQQATKNRPAIDVDLDESAVLLTAGSTAGLDALRQGVPVITLADPPAFKLPAYVEAGTTLHVGRGQSLTDAIRRVLSEGVPTPVQERSQKWVEHFYGPTDGRAADRVGDLLDSLV